MKMVKHMHNSEINMRILSSHLRTVLMVVQLNTMLIIIK